jgi:anti-sigma factor RsiW
MSPPRPRDIACVEIVELLTEYLEGSLPPDEVAAIDEHLRGCAACRRYLDQLRTTVVALGSLPRPTLSDDTVDALLAAFHDIHRNRPG